jgi:uncharacterized protein YceK
MNLRVGFAAVFILSTGCGTVRSLRTPSESIAGDPVKRVYGGIRENCSIIKDNSDSSKLRMLPELAIALRVIDMPFTALADTMVLPYTLAYDNRLFGFRCVYSPEDYQMAQDALEKTSLEP